ncbi:MAG: hypothetical protein AB7J13_14315 [Pyrinomonadaceae bacterium]
MATNFPADLTASVTDATRPRLSFEHRFFLTAAVLFPLVTIIGFAPSYYFKTLFDTPPLPTVLVHAHGALMSLWIILFSVQAYLISSKRVRWHITLGTLGVALALAVIVIGVMTGYASFARGASFPGYTPTEFFIVPIGDMVTFAIVFAAAIYYRKNAANHKRLMLVTMLNFLPPSIARLPLPFIPHLGTIWFFGVPDLIAVLLLAGDTYRTGKLNRAFAAGVTLMVVSGPLRMAIARTEMWGQFATWIISQ